MIEWNANSFRNPSLFSETFIDDGSRAVDKVVLMFRASDWLES